MNKLNIAWFVVNDENQPLFSPGNGQYWLFSTKKKAQKFIDKQKHIRPRIIVRVVWKNGRGGKLELLEKIK